MSQNVATLLLQVVPACRMKYWLVPSEDGAHYSRLSLLDDTQTEVCTRASSHIHTAEDTCYLQHGTHTELSHTSLLNLG